MMVAFALGASDETDLSALVAGQVCLIDDSFVPTFNWRHRTDLASGKHRRYKVNVQLLVDLHGRLLAGSQALPGSWHDVHCFRKAGWVELLRTSAGGRGDLGKVNPTSCTR